MAVMASLWFVCAFTCPDLLASEFLLISGVCLQSIVGSLSLLFVRLPQISRRVLLLGTAAWESTSIALVFILMNGLVPLGGEPWVFAGLMLVPMQWAVVRFEVGGPMVPLVVWVSVHSLVFGVEGGLRVWVFVLGCSAVQVLSARSVRVFVDEINRAEKRASEERDSRRGALDALSRGVAHDLRNALVPIEVNVALLREMLTDEVASATAQDLHRATRHASDLARELLSAAGENTLTLSTVNLSTLCRDLARIHSGPHGQVVAHVARDDMVVFGDKVQLRRVMQNLVVNALAFSNNRAVYVRTGLASTREIQSLEWPLGPGSGGMACWMEVEDEGPGMSSEELGHIFEPFYSRRPGGSGLGLASVRGIVRSHGGCMDVDSEVGRGTRIRVWIPESQIPYEETPPSAPPRKHSGQLLVVDDDAVIRRAMKRLLEGAGFSVILASGKADSIPHLTGTIPPRLVILDLQLVDGTGAELAQILHDHHPDVPVLVCSGGGEAPEAHLWAAVVHKPWSPADLLHTVARLTGVSFSAATDPSESQYLEGVIESHTDATMDIG